VKELFQFWFGMFLSKDNGDDDEDAPSKPPELKEVQLIRCIALYLGFLVFTGVCAYRLATITFNFAQFGFSELLSLILALFSMGLSATFYFQATNTSNKFYNRTYKLTKDLFEKLGRMEERFDQMLKHIHEDTSATRQDFAQSKGESKKTTTESVATTPAEIKSPKAVEEKS
jgi:hypothetical protein